MNDVAESGSESCSSTNTSVDSVLEDDGNADLDTEPRRVLTEVMMGEAIEAAFDVEDSEYETDADMFEEGESDDDGDDGLSDDEDSESGSSKIQEGSKELEAPKDTLNMEVVFAEGSSQYSEDSSFEEAETDVDDTYVDSDEDSEILERIKEADINLQYQEKKLDRMVCNLLGLEEQSRRIDEELEEARTEIEKTESVIRKTDRSLLIKLDRTGLSRELYAEVKKFCESLQPKRGMREGFSITCDEDHGGSYVLYDPDFSLFKMHVEFDYKVCN